MSQSIFAARCYASAAYVVMRCLCVCASVTFVHSVKTNKHIFKMFSLSGNQTILVFPYQTSRRYFDGDPPDGGVECRWGRLKSRLSTNISSFAINNSCTLVCISHLAAGFLVTAGIGRPNTTRYKQSHSSVTVYSAKPTKRGLALYTVTVDRESCV